ncbi:MAG: transketolase N-terminal domain protein [Parcubacteria group bacterium Gr01-1014_46]|nr:MAG: transketolase N-terminal domain protein [Parcubacteria group bacterium Gr01-1014_46]
MLNNLTDDKITFLTEKAKEIRISIIEMLVSAGSGHSAGPLGMADVFTALYFYILKHNPRDPFWEERDRLVLSNGHINPVLYATLAHAGYFRVEELLTLRKFGTRLQGHPHREFLPILENSSGPLGAGLSQAVGMAIADRMDKGKTSDRFFYCLLGDGELDEGQNWEAIMLASKEKLGNLIAIVDRNNIQLDGNTEDIMPLESLVHKFEAFGWHVEEIDGHNFASIVESVGRAQAVFDGPSVIIARTIPGKGVSFMERDYKWHGNPPGTELPGEPPKEEQAKIALHDLRTLGGQITGEHE